MEYPKDEDISAIKEWQWENGFIELANMAQALWTDPDYATLSDLKTNEFGSKYREFRLITQGWSGNEEIVGALKSNQMFFIMCWQSSHRGGLHIFHIPDVE